MPELTSMRSSDTGLGRVDSLDDPGPKKLAPDAIVVPVAPVVGIAVVPVF